MAKNEKFSIRKENNGNLTLGFGANSYLTINAQKMTKKDKFLAVKEEILKMGMVFTKKIEKKVRKELDFPHD